MAPVAALPVDEGRVLCDAVVPDHDGSLLPLDAGLEVSAEGDVVVQELEDSLGLLVLQADDVPGDCAGGSASARFIMESKDAFGAL